MGGTGENRSSRYLVKSDGVILQREVGEDDKATERNAKRQDTTHRHVLPLEDAKTGTHVQPNEGNNKVDECECGAYCAWI